jgi:UDP-N-acetylmuramoylalanine-D-glutamate ligase
MTSIKKTRKTIDEKIADLEQKLKDAKLARKEQAKKKAAKLTKDSPGINEAIAAIESAAKENKSTLGEVIKAIASAKRTGLTITTGTRGTKK